MFSLRSFIVASMLSMGASLPAHASLDGAKSYATGIADKVLTTLNQDITDEQKLSKLETLFKQNVDTSWIGQFVLGKHWKELSAEDQKRYLSAYRDFVVKSYTSKFAAFSGQTYKLGRSYTEADGDHSVTLRIVDPDGGPDIVTDYRVRENGSNFKVVDIAVEGVSLITTQRSEFGGFVERKGIGALVDALKKKTEKITASLQ